MKRIGKMSQAEVAAYVCAHLAGRGIRVALSGDAVVAIYCGNRYASQDVDLVDLYQVRHSALREHMQAVGFVEEGRCFRHPESTTLVEFPPGPLAIGAEPIGAIDELRLPTGVLRVTSPTDCMKDRLASFSHWGDRQVLSQAILVATHQRVDLEDVSRWSKVEGYAQTFHTFRAGIRSTPKT